MPSAGTGEPSEKAGVSRLPEPRKEDRPYLQPIFNPRMPDFRPPGGLIWSFFLFLSSLQMSMTEFIPVLGPQMTSTNLSFARNLTSQ